MRYQAFRDALTRALGEAGFVRAPGGARETLDLDTTTRAWKGHYSLARAAREPSAPFHLSSEVRFRWDPVDTARTYTTEGDLLRELFGGDDDLPPTLPRHLRIDLVLHATLPWGSRTPLPGAEVWRSWSGRVDDELADVLPGGSAWMGSEPLVVMGARGSVEVEARCAPDGELCLAGVSLSSWQAVVPPRVREALEGEADADEDPEEQLAVLADQYAGATEEWSECVAVLARQIEYRPPGQPR